MKRFQMLLFCLLFTMPSYSQKSYYVTEARDDFNPTSTNKMTGQINAGASIGNTFYFFSQQGDVPTSAAYKVQNDGSLTKFGHGFPGSSAGNGYFSAVLFKKALYLFYWSENYLCYNAVGPNGEDLGGNAIKLPSFSSPEGLAAVAVGDELFIFYHDVSSYYLKNWPSDYYRDCLKCVRSSDLKNWTEMEIDDLSQSGISPTGAVQASACYAKDGTRNIMVLCTNTKKGFGYYLFKVSGLLQSYVGGNYLTKYFDVDPNILSGFGVLEGSVNGAGTGDMVQVFYVTRGGLYDHGDNVYRMEYSVKTDTWSQPELLNFKMNTEYGKMEHCQPAVFPAYQNVGNDRKKQVVFGFVKNVVQGGEFSSRKFSQSMLLARWDSDVLKLDSTYVEQDPDPQFCTLVGVVEGPPPYTLNGKSWERLDDFYEPSKIQYGTSSTTIDEKTSSWSTKLEISVGLGDDAKKEGKGGFVDLSASFKWDGSTQNTYEKTVSQEKEIYSYEEGNDCYQLWIKPIIQRDRYKLFDWKGNDLSKHVYFFTVTKSILDWDVIDMKDIDGAPNSSDFSSFINRKYDPEKYPSKWFANISWQEGSSSTNSLKKTEATTYENAFTKTFKANAGVHLGLFHVSGGFEAEISLKSSVTSSISEDLAVILNSPSPTKNDNVPDTTKFAGNFYWITPSSTLKNWWIPAGFEADKPWCMTYKITSVNGKIVPRLVSGVDNPASDVPTAFSLGQNYPNPFNPLTRIEYSIPQQEYVTLKIYSVLGAEIATLLSEHLAPGNYVVTWRPQNLASGVYYYEIRAGEFRQTKKMLLCK